MPTFPRDLLVTAKLLFFLRQLDIYYSIQHIELLNYAAKPQLCKVAVACFMEEDMCELVFYRLPVLACELDKHTAMGTGYD